MSVFYIYRSNKKKHRGPAERRRRRWEKAMRLRRQRERSSCIGAIERSRDYWKARAKRAEQKLSETR